MAERETARAGEETRRGNEQEETKGSEFQKPLDRTSEQLMELMQVVNRAVDRRQSEDQSLPLSEQPLHRSRSKDQQFGAQWGQTFEGRLAPTISFGAIIFGRSAYLGAQVLQHPGGSLAT